MPYSVISEFTGRFRSLLAFASNFWTQPNPISSRGAPVTQVLFDHVMLMGSNSFASDDDVVVDNGTELDISHFGVCASQWGMAGKKTQNLKFQNSRS